MIKKIVSESYEINNFREKKNNFFYKHFSDFCIMRLEKER